MKLNILKILPGLASLSLCLLWSSAIAQDQREILKDLEENDEEVIKMSEEAHAFFLQKVVLVDSLEEVVVSLEERINHLKDSLETSHKDFVRMLIESDKIRTELEHTRFALDLEVKELNRQLKLLKISRRQRKAMLRKYYPKLTREQRYTILSFAALSSALGIILTFIE